MKAMKAMKARKAMKPMKAMRVRPELAAKWNEDMDEAYQEYVDMVGYNRSFQCKPAWGWRECLDRDLLPMHAVACQHSEIYCIFCTKYMMLMNIYIYIHIFQICDASPTYMRIIYVYIYIYTVEQLI